MFLGRRDRELEERSAYLLGLDVIGPSAWKLLCRRLGQPIGRGGFTYAFAL